MMPRQYLSASHWWLRYALLDGKFLLVCLLCIALSGTLTAQNSVHVLFKNGDHILGNLVPSHDSQRIAIQSDRFVKPLEFHLNAIGSIDNKEQALANPDGQLVFVLNNHSTIMGTLLELNDERVKIKSLSLGEVVFPRKLLSEIGAESQRGKLLFSGPRAGQAWKAQPKDTAWSMEGGALVNGEPGQVLRGNASLSGKREVRIALSWTKTPNFVVSLGTAKDVANESKVHEPTTCSLETWGSTLVLVRTTDTAVDFAPIGQVTEESRRLDLIIYIDEKKFEVVACSPGGKVLGRLADDVKHKALGLPMIKLVNANNKGGQLRLERLIVREWNGRLPSETNATGTGIACTDEQFHQGKVEEFDAAEQLFKIISADKQSKSVPLNKVRRIFFESNAADLTSFNESVEVQYSDGSSCIGVWKSLKENEFQLKLEGLQEPLVSKLDQVIALSGNAIAFTAESSTARTGVLESTDTKLTGSLSESSNDGELNWFPVTASAPGQLSLEFEGKVFYEATVATAPKPPPPDPRVAAVRARALRGVRNPALVEEGESKKFKALSVGLTFRTGDVINGKVLKIDERGVTFVANDKTSTIASNQMESITLVDSARIVDLPPEKLKHLMTIPRSAKKDPPTHLFVSINGDYLRGRLIKYVDGRVTAEIRLENVEFPADTIAQIFWLHSRDWEETEPKKPENDAGQSDEDVKPKDDAEQQVAGQLAPSAILQVHALQRKEKSLTFTPKKIEISGDATEQTIAGHSDLLGECSVRVQELTSLLIGRNVGALVRKTQKDAWKLSVAALPKAFQESDTADQTSSSLVGKPAPDFELKTITDERFTLSKLQGRVVVLDFWASWCGPCMQTMPEVDRIVAELQSDQVSLVTVNLQESKDRAIAAMKRLGLSPIVALDIDGEVAQKYEANAIPQTVIIDREGNVTHLFIGGGAKFLQQFSNALTSVLDKK